MSEITTRSVESQTKMRAVVADTPVADKENVIEFAPGFKFNDFYNEGGYSTVKGNRKVTAYKLIRCQS